MYSTFNPEQAALHANQQRKHLANEFQAAEADMAQLIRWLTVTAKWASNVAAVTRSRLIASRQTQRLSESKG